MSNVRVYEEKKIGSVKVIDGSKQKTGSHLVHTSSPFMRFEDRLIGSTVTTNDQKGKVGSVRGNQYGTLDEFGTFGLNEPNAMRKQSQAPIDLVYDNDTEVVNFDQPLLKTPDFQILGASLGQRFSSFQAEVSRISAKEKFKTQRDNKNRGLSPLAEDVITGIPLQPIPPSRTTSLRRLPPPPPPRPRNISQFKDDDNFAAEKTHEIKGRKALIDNPQEDDFDIKPPGIRAKNRRILTDDFLGELQRRREGSVKSRGPNFVESLDSIKSAREPTAKPFEVELQSSVNRLTARQKLARGDFIQKPIKVASGKKKGVSKPSLQSITEGKRFSIDSGVGSSVGSSTGPIEPDR